MLPDLITGIIALVLTLLVFSRLFGDNPAFRAVQYAFVGASLGFAFVVVYFQVLRPAAINLLDSFADPLRFGLALVPFVLGLLLIPRVSRRQNLSWLANIPLGLLFGVATALALGGALVGTLVPQLHDTIRTPGNDPAQLAGTVVLAFGVVLTLLYFSFTLPRSKPAARAVLATGQVGRWLLMVTFGFFFAGSVLTYLTALNERLSFLVNWVAGFLR